MWCIVLPNLGPEPLFPKWEHVLSENLVKWLVAARLDVYVSYRSEIRQARRQHCCRGACQIWKRPYDHEPYFANFARFHGKAVRHLTTK